MHCVLDSSATLAWILAGEVKPANEALLTETGEHGAMAHGLWPIDIPTCCGLPNDADGSASLNEPGRLPSRANCRSWLTNALPRRRSERYRHSLRAWA